MKTGVLSSWTGDFRKFGLKKFENGATGDFREIKKARYWRGLSATKEENSLKRGMSGWRPSADRACLYTIPC
jgi:hypothetical protein